MDGKIEGPITDSLTGTLRKPAQKLAKPRMPIASALHHEAGVEIAQRDACTGKTDITLAFPF